MNDCPFSVWGGGSPKEKIQGRQSSSTSPGLVNSKHLNIVCINGERGKAAEKVVL